MFICLPLLNANTSTFSKLNYFDYETIGFDSFHYCIVIISNISACHGGL